MPKTTTSRAPARKRATSSTPPRKRAATTTRSRAERAAPVIFIGTRSRPDRPLRVRAFLVDTDSGQLTDVELPEDLVGRARTFFTVHDGGVPPIVIVTPPPPRGPGGTDLRQIAAVVRERAR